MISDEKLSSIFSHFQVSVEFQPQFQPISEGLINTSYMVLQQNMPKYILQQINAHVFSKPHLVVNNKQMISDFLQTPEANYPLENMKLMPLKGAATACYFQPEDGHWNLIEYIPHTQISTAHFKAALAYEAGKAIGIFHRSLMHFPVKLLHESIPNFHYLPSRIFQFEEACKNATSSRLSKASNLISNIYLMRRKYENAYKEAVEYLPVRVTHNDAKLANMLFDETGKVKAIIDWDTIMTGFLMNDMGDAARTMAATKTENATDFENVRIDHAVFHALYEGYASEIYSILTPNEIKWMKHGAAFIILEQCIRFLTDYLQNDIYYKIEYEMHNLNRATNQMHLLQSLPAI